MNARSIRQRKNARAMGATLFAATCVALIAWRWAPRGEVESPPSTVVAQGGPMAPRAPTQKAPTLVQPGELDGPGDLAAARSERTTAPRLKNKTARSTLEVDPKAKPKKPTKAKAPSDPGVEKYPLIIRPSIDTRMIEVLDSGSPMTLSAVAPGGGKRTRTVSFLGQRPSLKLGAAPNTMAAAVAFTVDHPDAMPTVVGIHPEDWGFDGANFVVSPTVSLEPVEGRLHLARSVPETLNALTRARRFSGQCALVNVDPWGSVRVMDSTDQSGPGVRRPPMLRFVRRPGRTFILGTPESPAATGDLIEVTGQLNGGSDPKSLLKVPTMLRGMTPPPLRFSVVDPFGEPVKGDWIVGAVPHDAIALLDQHGAPVIYDDFVFTTSKPVGHYVGGQLYDGQTVSPTPLALVRMGGGAETDAGGEALIKGHHVGIHRFYVRSHFGTILPLMTEVESSDVTQLVKSPVVGLEVFCPLEWQNSKEGREAWARAKVEVSGKSRPLPWKGVESSTARARRYLVPSNTPLTVTCTAKGRPVATARVAPQPARSRIGTSPEAPPTAKKSLPVKK
ncbi:MAG: hypothetical protein ACJAZN_000664 [Planctomycetota bacterium]|jgi:hypothetical protein